MSDICKIVVQGRLTKDPEVKSYGAGKSLTQINVACTIGLGDNATTLYHNCTAFGKTGESLAKHRKKGDQIFIIGTPTQNKKDNTTYYGVRIDEWSFGANAKGNSGDNSSHDTGSNNYDDDDIPF